MEMLNSRDVKMARVAFKIDLIVWKFEAGTGVGKSAIGLK